MYSASLTIPGQINQLPGTAGSYAVCFRLGKPVYTRIGVGLAEFPAGIYLYTGSACGSGGIRARLSHHFRPSNKPHWHMDWIKPWAELLACWYRTGTQKLECQWSQQIKSLPHVQAPAPGFGASDCRNGCQAHLLLLPEDCDLIGLAQQVNAEYFYWLQVGEFNFK